MNHTSISPVRRLRRWNLVAALALAVPLTAFAQPTPPDHAAHQAAGTRPPTTAPAGMAAAESIAVLQAKVAKLEAALQAKAGGVAAASEKPMTDNTMPMDDQPMGRKAMGGNMAAKPMATDKPMMDGDKGMGAMGGGKMSGGMPMPMPMPMMDKMMGMMGMPPGVGANAMPAPTALPGFPGASHLYHIGSTGFFLDHAQHITLSVEQQTSLNVTKEKALLDKASGQRAIDAAEQDLWTLTASDRPDAASIEAKVHEIEKLRADQRLAFIRAVGTAATLLTDPQRQSLLGQLPPQTLPADPAAMPMPTAAPGMPATPADPAMPAGGMPDM